ncbi:MAG: DUF4860 domain-containing protein [Clostridia bacterium]|nr:DUF4860 domain-containing protein [Clostridia bacterium]
MSSDIGKRTRRHIIADAFVFVLLGVFALASMFLILAGTKAYRDTVDNADYHSRQRILANYVVNKVRMGEATGTVAIIQGDVPVLRIGYFADGESYATNIYCYGGYLMEQFSQLSDAFDPEIGEVLCEAEYFAPSINDGLYTFETGTSDGEVYTAYLAVRCDPA